MTSITEHPQQSSRRVGWEAPHPSLLGEGTGADAASLSPSWGGPRGGVRSRRGERGQSLVEFALTLPLLLLLLLGTIDLGMGFRTYIALTNAAREGVRWISLNPSDVPNAIDRVNQEAGHIGLSVASIGNDGYTVSVTPAKARYAAGETVTVSVVYEYRLLFGLLTGIPAVPFTAQASMMVLYDE